jgi:hypothetical protein
VTTATADSGTWKALAERRSLGIRALEAGSEMNPWRILGDLQDLDRRLHAVGRLLARAQGDLYEYRPPV